MPGPRLSRPDPRYGDDPTAAPWARTDRLLADAELYWLSTVRADGRPHVTPLIGAWFDDRFHFASGAREQKVHNLLLNPQVAVTTGANAWAAGTDVVLEGTAQRLTEPVRLQAFADATLAKYGEAWRFTVHGDGVGDGDHPAWVFAVTPAKVLTFGKEPHSQTAHMFD
ncbi:pyridoxamine 5'-phosphate oxidase family protein [Occultella glacieicola]|uniref:Pyridoxamine 5'-phosphate oxidase family protein n=1 Tax=Occultella glacieicola TaxID=2518684 RepID=A0ABY2E3Q1_9MICO|nr:pyridoxamine 5'-phosphate oxidase family protein [Occultella glacieicola]TDE94257.1 pyridoxamine 5'-phosphate oxidase family protein [Occultella glacieicola]